MWEGIESSVESSGPPSPTLKEPLHPQLHLLWRQSIFMVFSLAEFEDIQDL